MLTLKKKMVMHSRIKHSSKLNRQHGCRIRYDNIYPTSSTPTGLTMDPEVWGAFFDKVNYVGAFGSKATAWTNGWTEFWINPKIIIS